MAPMPMDFDSVSKEEVLAEARRVVDGDKERETILAEAGRVVDGDRERLYGHPSQNFIDTAKMWEVILRRPVTPAQVAMCMIALKLAREKNKHTRDNLVDIAGYARTIEKMGPLASVLPIGTGMGRCCDPGDNPDKRQGMVRGGNSGVPAMGSGGGSVPQTRQGDPE